MKRAVLVALLSFSTVSGMAAHSGCRSAQGGSPTSQPVATTTPPAPPPVAKKSAFDADRAFANVKKQVEFGPRPAGSPALRKTREWLISELKSYGLKVTTQAFVAKTPSKKFPTIPMENIIAELPGKTDDVIIVSSHYDTKYFEKESFVGANDGGSSTGALLEIARVLAAMKPEERNIPQTLQFVFFDGEEAVVEWQDGDNTYGSRHMVEELKASGKDKKVKAMILLDMIGDKDLEVPKEAQSMPWLAEIITETGRSLGYEKEFPMSSHYISDDHIPFLQAGIPAVDLIDFTFGTDPAGTGPGGEDNAYWHTSGDTLDKLSPRSLKVIGDTILAALPKIAARVQ
jgi:Zn-dependent M28 family amino/carboxypeptidase